MTATAKRKPSVSIPTLAERATVLLEELLEAPASERREILTWWREALDCAIGDLAEALRPKGENGIPVNWIKMQLRARGHGECPCQALAEALRDA
jgi:hypothetical protein